jgi:hypothetical protein
MLPRPLQALLTAIVLAAGGCGLPQDPACTAWVACQQALDPSVDTVPYDDSGSCWANPPQARLCASRCQNLLAVLRDIPNAPAACREEP